MDSVAFKVKSAFDIVDFLKREGLALVSSGGDRWSVCCPFHGERVPSFVVNSLYQNFRCFGCGESGDIFSYVMRAYGFEYRQALEFLAGLKGIPLDKGSVQDLEVFKRSRRVVALAGEFFRSCFDRLPDSHPAVLEVVSRGLSRDSGFYGYAPRDTGKVLEFFDSRGFSVDDLKQAGLVSERGNFLWSDRLMFTFCDVLGHPVGFSGRALGNIDGWKYVNSGNGLLFRKDRVLFGVERARRAVRESGRVFVVEGQFDVVAMQCAGFVNTVGVSGAVLSRSHLNVLSRLAGSSGRIVLLFDGDGAGLKAVERVFESFPDLHYNFEVVLLPSVDGVKVDPCEFLAGGGVLPEPVSLCDFYFNLFKERACLESAQGRVDFVKGLEERFFRFVSDEVICESYRGEVEKLTGVSVKVSDDRVVRGSAGGSVGVSPLQSFLAFYVKYWEVTGRVDPGLFPERFRVLFERVNSELGSGRFFVDRVVSGLGLVEGSALFKVLTGLPGVVVPDFGEESVVGSQFDALLAGVLAYLRKGEFRHSFSRVSGLVDGMSEGEFFDFLAKC